MAPAEEMCLWTNGTETVAARDAEDAAAVLREHLGEESGADMEFKAVPDEKVIAVWVDDAPDWNGCACSTWARADCAKQTYNGHHPSCGVGRPSMTAREWASKGRGIVCSTEW